MSRLCYAFAITASIVSAAVKQADDKYIGCAVCKEMIDQAFTKVAIARESAPYKKISEDDIETILGNLCNSEHTIGEWMKMNDIIEVKEGDIKYLELHKHQGQQKCKEECKSIEKSCRRFFDEEVDMDELMTYLWKNKSDKDGTIDKACMQMTNRCTKKLPLPSNYKRVDYPFFELSGKDLEMERLMASMKSAGMGGAEIMDGESMQEKMMSGDFGGMDDMYGDDPYSGGGFPGGGDFAGGAGEQDFEL